MVIEIILTFISFDSILFMCSCPSIIGKLIDRFA